MHKKTQNGHKSSPKLTFKKMHIIVQKCINKKGSKVHKTHTDKTKNALKVNKSAEMVHIKLTKQ